MCVCTGASDLHERPCVYEALVGSSVEMEWTFPFSPNQHTDILCNHTSSSSGASRILVLQPSNAVVDTYFRGRVSVDQAALEQGRLRVNVSGLRAEDSGRISCDIITGERGSGECQLLVSAAPEPTQAAPEKLPEKPPESSPGGALTVTRGRFGLYFVLTSLFIIIIIFCACRRTSSATSNQAEGV